MNFFVMRIGSLSGGGGEWRKPCDKRFSGARGERLVQTRGLREGQCRGQCREFACRLIREDSSERVKSITSSEHVRILCSIIMSRASGDRKRWAPLDDGGSQGAGLLMSPCKLTPARRVRGQPIRAEAIQHARSLVIHSKHSEKESQGGGSLSQCIPENSTLSV